MSLVNGKTKADPRSPGRHYNANGGGRDSYIFNNNGGFSVPNTNSYQAPLGSMNRGGRPYKYHSPKRQIEGRPIHYINDGTGRDTYIIETRAVSCSTEHMVEPQLLHHHFEVIKKAIAKDSADHHQTKA